MTRGVAIIVGLAVALFVLSSSFYTVSEVEQVVLTQFGEPVDMAVKEPGPHFKLPFIQVVHRFDKRWLDWDGDAGEMPTREKTYISVDTYARWRIVDPLKFFTSVRDERNAQSRLDDIIDSETRNVVAAHDLIEVVRSTDRKFEVSADYEGEEGGSGTQEHEIKVGRDKITRMVLEKAAKAMPDYGIELVDLQFQRVKYTSTVNQKVFERMIAERQRIAERYRSEGQGKRAEILGRKERELKRIESEAYRKVQEIKGQADAQATSTYAAAHNRDPDLYRLIKSLESYRKSIDEETWVILSTDSDYLRPLVQGAER
ncbi:MAG: protease modulator HflC [Myxococcota bacterium]